MTTMHLMWFNPLQGAYGLREKSHTEAGEHCSKWERDERNEYWVTPAVLNFTQRNLERKAPENKKGFMSLNFIVPVLWCQNAPTLSHFCSALLLMPRIKAYQIWSSSLGWRKARQIRF